MVSVLLVVGMQSTSKITLTEKYVFALSDLANNSQEQ